jgi:hypothetical protein
MMEEKMERYLVQSLDYNWVPMMGSTMDNKSLEHWMKALTKMAYSSLEQMTSV